MKCKRHIALALSFLLVFSYAGLGYAVANEEEYKAEFYAQRMEKVRELEETYDAEIRPDERYGNLYLEPGNLEKIEEFLKVVSNKRFVAPTEIVRIDGYPDGTYSSSWTDDWDFWASSGSVSWRMRGTSRIDGIYTVSHPNGMLHLTGSVTNADFVGESLGSPSFWSGTLNIGYSTGDPQGRFATMTPEATLKFTVPVGYGVTSYLQTFVSSYWIFIN